MNNNIIQDGKVQEVMSLLNGEKSFVQDMAGNALYESLLRAMNIVFCYDRTNSQYASNIGNYGKMQTDLTELASLNLWISSLVGQLEASEKMMDYRRKCKKADIQLEIIKKLNNGEIKGKLTESGKEAMIQKDETYAKYMDVYLEASKALVIVSKAQEAVREMMQVLKINLRLNMDSERHA